MLDRLDVRAVNNFRHLHWLTALNCAIGSKRVFAPVATRSPCGHDTSAACRLPISRIARRAPYPSVIDRAEKHQTGRELQQSGTPQEYVDAFTTSLRAEAS